MPFVTLSSSLVSPAQFVDRWRRGYTADDSLYDDNIGLDGGLTTDNVVALMGWKAGRFSERGGDFARAIPVELLNDARAQAPLTDEAFGELLAKVTEHLHDDELQKTDAIIWRIFLCHLAQPLTTPIYDRYVWRAWGFIEEWLEPKHLEQVPVTIDSYLEYRRWFNGLVSAHALDARAIDQALVTFGRLLSSPWRACFFPEL